MVRSTLAVLKQIKAAAQGAGRQYAGDNKFMKPAAKEVMAHVLEMLVAFGAVQKPQAKQIYDQAVQELEGVMGGAQPQQPQGMLAQGA